MKPALVFTAALAFGCMASAGQASDAKSGQSCPQALAVYSSEDKSVSVEFSGAEDLSFAMLIQGADRSFDGFIFPSTDEGATEAVVLDNCPDGDATGDEIAACTIWRGPFEIVVQDGSTDVFPLVHGPAVSGLYLSGLAEQISRRMPDLMADPYTSEVETLTLSGCLE